MSPVCAPVAQDWGREGEIGSTDQVKLHVAVVCIVGEETGHTVQSVWHTWVTADNAKLA